MLCDRFILLWIPSGFSILEYRRIDVVGLRGVATVTRGGNMCDNVAFEYSSGVVKVHYCTIAREAEEEVAQL